MIKNNSKDLTLILYNSPKAPKYLKINKAVAKSLLISLPILILLSLFLSLGTSIYMKDKLERTQAKEPELIASLRKTQAQLNSKIEELNSENAKLINKLNTSAVTTPSTSLELFTIPIGFTDRTEETSARLDNFRFTTGSSNRLKLVFDLYNNLSSGEKLSGFIYIHQYSKNAVHFYPQLEFTLERNKLLYTQGESFTVSRFRPVEAEFKNTNSSNIWYKVYIFSRTGDLLDYKIVGPYDATSL